MNTDKQETIIINTNNNTNNTIYRFKFTDDIMTYLTSFAKKNQYVDRNTYKEAWGFWLDENSEIVENECDRLQKLGYDGDVKDKMFKSARYYFRKKSNKTSEPQKRKNYVPIDQDILSAMDVHIQRNMYDETYSPANGYSEFCQCSETILSDEILRLLDSGLTKEEIMMKIKKTYKNRYFINSRLKINYQT